MFPPLVDTEKVNKKGCPGPYEATVNVCVPCRMRKLCPLLCNTAWCMISLSALHFLLLWSKLLTRKWPLHCSTLFFLSVFIMWMSFCSHKTASALLYWINGQSCGLVMWAVILPFYRYKIKVFNIGFGLKNKNALYHLCRSHFFNAML